MDCWTLEFLSSMSADFCYWCGAEATSREHVPPKCLFPEQKDAHGGSDHRKNLITVPSCDVHNLAKCKEDEYLLCILGINILANPIGERQGKTKIIRALTASGGLAHAVLNQHQKVRVEDTKTGTVSDSIAIKIDDASVLNSFDHVARAIFFHHFNSRWSGSVQCTPEFLLNENASINKEYETIRQEADELFANSPLHGTNPDVFGYQFVGRPDVDSQLLLRLHFYGEARVSVVLLPAKSSSVAPRA